MKERRTLNSMVLIEPINEEQKTAGGIIVVEQTRKRKPKRGVLIKVAENSKVEVGETVIYPIGIATEVNLPDETGNIKTYDLLPEVSLMMVP